MKQESNCLNDYLAVSDVVNFDHAAVKKKAFEIASVCRPEDKSSVAEACFYFVRDQIKHSGDHACEITTCKASDVLEFKTGFCFAKSHLLVALLRCNGIPAAFCYQRLYNHQLFCLHGLVAIWLKDLGLKDSGWYRVDPRGNTNTLRSSFCPPVEDLAFQPLEPGEKDFLVAYVDPIKVVTEGLTRFSSAAEFEQNIPDLESVFEQ